MLGKEHPYGNSLMVFGHKERCGRVSGPEYVHGPALFHLITGPLTIF